MFSIRLSNDMEKRIKELAEKNKVNKSDIVKEALQDYLAKEESKESPYKLGEDLFGQYSSGDGSLSENYRLTVKEKIREKRTD